MNTRKKIAITVVAITLLGLAGYQIHSSRLANEVERLMGELRERGVSTNWHYVAGKDEGADVSSRLYGINRIRGLRKLDLTDRNATEARKLLTSAEPYFGSISDFAQLDSYSRRRVFNDPAAFDDISPLAAAIHAEGWRGYLLACDGKANEALGAVKNLKGFMERMQDERYPIGMAVAVRAQDRLSRILLALANRAKKPEEVDRLIASARLVPTLNYKESFAANLATSLNDIDMYESGKYEANDPHRILGLRFSFGRTAAYYDALRIEVLKHAITLHDNWDETKLDMLSADGMSFANLDLGQGILGSYSMVSVGQLQADRNHIAKKRALLLTLAAHKHRSTTGKMPTVEQLQAAEFDATDPWGGAAMTLHQDENRIWVGGLRKNRKSLNYDAIQTMEILEWRP